MRDGASLMRLWLPMAGTWLFMSLESPFLAAVIARGEDPKQNLAAFGVAYAMAILVESPVIMILSASTALVAGREALRRLGNFTNALNATVTVLMAGLLLTPAWHWIATRAMELPPHVVELTETALLLMLPWPAAIGYRRFWQGLLIRDGQTRRVAYGTIVRLATMATTVLVLSGARAGPGAVLAAAAMTAGVSAEALCARWMVRHLRRRILADDREEPEPLDYAGIGRFYFPLALTSAISLSIHPIVSFGLGRGRFPLESLAVMPVVNSLSFVFRSAGLSFQEVAIAVLGREAASSRHVLRFATGLALVASGAMALLVFTPLARVWFEDLSGLSAELSAFALPAAMILVPLPALSVVLALERAVLVHARRTTPITRATAVEVGATVLALYVGIQTYVLAGATAAAIAFVSGRIAGNLWMLPPLLRWRHENSP